MTRVTFMAPPSQSEQFIRRLWACGFTISLLGGSDTQYIPADKLRCKRKQDTLKSHLARGYRLPPTVKATFGNIKSKFGWEPHTKCKYGGDRVISAQALETLNVQV